MDPLIVIPPVKVKINKEFLIIKMDDHFEFAPEFIPYLKYIDLSKIDSEFLKVSGIDFRGTNIIINPQEVYYKDLSYSYFTEDNFGNEMNMRNFNDCNLCGSTLDLDRYAWGFETARTDMETKLPLMMNK